jgi:hypothetical protein
LHTVRAGRQQRSCKASPLGAYTAFPGPPIRPLMWPGFCGHKEFADIRLSRRAAARFRGVLGLPI